MKKLTKLICALVLVTSVGVASASASPTEFKNAVGVSYLGLAYGLQYQRWITNIIGIQTEGALFYGNNSSNDLNYNINVECQFKLYETDWGEKTATNLFFWVLAGNHGYTNYYNDDNTFHANAIVGLGFGIDTMFLNHISIPIQFGYMGEFPNDTAFSFIFGTGLRYRF